MRAPRAVTVVGAGAFGVSAALELARRGHAVTVIDAGPVPHPAASSTDTSKAVRPDYGRDGFYTDLALESLARWREWSRESSPPLLHEVGILLLTPGEMAPGSFEADSYELLRGRGLAVEALDRRTLAERFPAWADTPYGGGYFNPQAGWIASAAAVAALAARARRAGVVIREGARSTEIWIERSVVRGVVLEGGERLESPTVVAAAGAWTPEIVPGIRELTWAIGQPVEYRRPEDARPFEGSRFPVWCADIARTGWYGFPATDEGLVKIGHHGPGRRVLPGEPLEVVAEERERFRAFVERVFPALATAPPVRTRLCLYCDTFDGDFLIDRDPAHEGLVVACGGSGHAFKFTPVLGPLIADIVEGRANPRASRFAWRGPGPRRTEQARHTG